MWCFEYFDSVAKCILMPPQDLEKVGWFQSRKNNKWIDISIKKNWKKSKTWPWLNWKRIEKGKRENSLNRKGEKIQEEKENKSPNRKGI